MQQLRKLCTRKNSYAFFSSILFIGCTAFVAYCGYSCYDKYLKKPTHSEVSYEASKNHPFPSFTVCASQSASYNYDQLKECQIEASGYLWSGPWVGKGGSNCTDPKLLNKQVVANYEDLKIERIQIFTNAGSNDYHDIQPSFLEWKLALITSIGPYQRCFTFSMPDNIVHEGILGVRIISQPFNTLYLHKEGTLTAPIPGSSLGATYADLYIASVTHESIELINYDGKNCNNDGEYNYDKCKQDYIYKVSLNENYAIGQLKIKLFFIGKYGHNWLHNSIWT